MAVLADADRFTCWAEFMRRVGRDTGVEGSLPAMTKVDIRAAVNAVDDWVNTNATAFNTAIPQPARAQLTTRQKALLLLFVVDRRFGVL